MLRKALKKAGPVLRFSEHLSAEQGDAMFRHACAMGLEGIVSKKVTSRYKSGRCPSWRKVKNPAYERRCMRSKTWQARTKTELLRPASAPVVHQGRPPSRR